LQIDGWGNLVVAALLLGIVNAVIRPIILILTLPLTRPHAGALYPGRERDFRSPWSPGLMPGFSLSGLGAAILASIVVGLTSWFASAFVGGSAGSKRYRRIEVTGPPARLMDRTFATLGAVSGLVAVAAGAFGAHALRARLAPDQLAAFETGARYQMYHALALLLVGWGGDRWAAPPVRAAGWLFVAGTVVFLRLPVRAGTQRHARVRPAR